MGHHDRLTKQHQISHSLRTNKHAPFSVSAFEGYTSLSARVQDTAHRNEKCIWIDISPADQKRSSGPFHKIRCNKSSRWNRVTAHSEIYIFTRRCKPFLKIIIPHARAEQLSAAIYCRCGGEKYDFWNLRVWKPLLTPIYDVRCTFIGGLSEAPEENLQLEIIEQLTWNLKFRLSLKKCHF